MRMRLNKKFVKRSLELIGAVAVVYLMLEVLESHTMDKNDVTRNIQVRLPQANGEIEEIAVPADELQHLQAQLLQVKREQAQAQAQAMQRPNNNDMANHAPPAAAAQVEEPQVTERKVVEKPKQSPVTRAKPTERRVPKPEVKDVEKPKRKIPQADNAGIRPLSGKSSPDLGVNTNFDELNIPEPKLKSSGYVLPMLYFDMGPNNLFRLFRQGAVTAYEMGRTAVVPVFHRHPRMGDAAANPFVLPIFDQNYTVDLVWPPTDTIDPGTLKKVMGVSSMKDFRKDCKGHLDVLVKCGQLDAKRLEGIQHFQRAADLKINKEISIDTYEELVPNDLSPGVVGPDEYKCMGIIYGKKCLASQDRWLATFSRIAKSFMRPLPCRKFAASFIENVMGGQPYMAVHWRYESDWLDMCKPSRPKGARERNKEICRLTMGLTYDDEIRNNFIQAIKDKMADYSLKQLFLASPPNNIDLIRLMNESFPGNFYYSDDLTQYAKKTEGEGFLTNNYKGSFIEQEVCFKSTLFLGSSLSSWTQTVLTDRLARGIKRHDSVLHVVGKGAPGFPALIFQFPEGKFNFGGMIPGKKV